MKRAGFLSSFLASILAASILIPATSHADGNLACPAPVKSVRSQGSLLIAGQAAQLTSVVWGSEQGCFQKYGLDVKTSVVASSQAAIAGLVSGTYDMTVTTPTNLIMAIANGDFDGQIIAPRHGYTAEEIARAKREPLYPGELLLQTVLLVNKNSSINSWKDLENRKVAVRSFKGSDQAGVMLAMRSAGANPSKVEWLSMTDAQMSAALDRGDIDAAVPADPNASQMILKGARVIGYPYAYYAQPGAAIIFISSKAITAKKTQAMRAYKKATQEINKLLNQAENQPSFRKSIAKFTGVSEEAAAKGRLPTMIEGEVRFSDYSYLPKALKSLGFTKNRIDLAPILFR